MEQNADPGANPASVVERIGEVRPAVWLKFHQVKGAKEILERTSRLPGFLRFKVPQTVHAFRIPEGQSYRATLPDGRKHVMTEGIYEINPPAHVNAGDEIRFRCLEARIPANALLPTPGELDAHVDAVWNDPVFDSEPPLPDRNLMTAVEEESFGELEADVLELIEDTVSTGNGDAPASQTLTPRSERLPALSFGIRLKRHPGILSRLFRTSNREGSR